MIPENPVEEYLKLTDPTPLTVERLVERGAKFVVADAGYILGTFAVWVGGGPNPEFWEWTCDEFCDLPSWLNPLTLGQLYQLERRMKQ